MPVVPRQVLPSLAALCVLVAPATAQRPAAAIAEALATIQRDAPGCAAAIERGGTLLAAGARGSADLATGDPVTPETVFYAGSVSKQFVAAAVLLLAERGALEPDDPVGRHLPELHPSVGIATLRQLMQHTGGVADYLSLATLRGRDWSDRFDNREALDLLWREDSLQFVPGTAWRYSNGGYLLLAEVVARVSGQSFRSFADSAIIAPLGMASSHFHDELEHRISDLAIGYRSDPNGVHVAWPLRFAAVGSGGLYTSVLDLVRWSGNWWDNRLGVRRHDLPTRLSVRATLASGDTLDYALGVIVTDLDGRRVRRHGGGLAGYRAALLQFPEEHLGIAVLCNGSRLSGDAIANDIARRYFGTR